MASIKPVKSKQDCSLLEQNLCLKQSLILDRLKNEDNYCKQYAKSLARGQPGNAKEEKLTEDSEVTKMLELWVDRAISDGIKLYGDVLRRSGNDLRILSVYQLIRELAVVEDGWIASRSDVA